MDRQSYPHAKIDLEKVPFHFLALPALPVTDSTHFLQDVIDIHWPPLFCSLAFRTWAMGAAIARPGRLLRGEIKVAF